MKIEYKPLFITITAFFAALTISIITCLIKMATIDMLFSNEFLYWDTLKTVLLIFAIALAVLVIILITTLILNKKNVAAEKFIAVILVLFVVSVTVVASVLGSNDYKNSKLEMNSYTADNIYNEYADILYLKNIESSDAELNKKTITNSEAVVKVIDFKNDNINKELKYYEIATDNSILTTLFQFNLFDFYPDSSYQVAYNINDAINSENRIDGLDYYIFETDDHYVYHQIPSHESKMAYSHAKKTDGYSMQDFESDILKIKSN